MTTEQLLYEVGRLTEQNVRMTAWNQELLQVNRELVEENEQLRRLIGVPSEEQVLEEL